MSIDPFPERVIPRKLCNRNGSINSTIPLGKLPRFSEYLDDDQGQAEVCLSFDRDASGHCVITGSVKTDVSMPCQRCLEPTSIGLHADLALKVAEDDGEAERMAQAALDPNDRLGIVVCTEGQLDLLAVIEDELIMALPTVARHEDSQCSRALNKLQDGAANLADKTGGNGLAALEELRQVLKQQDKK